MKSKFGTYMVCGLNKFSWCHLDIFKVYNQYLRETWKNIFQLNKNNYSIILPNFSLAMEYVEVVSAFKWVVISPIKLSNWQSRVWIVTSIKTNTYIIKEGCLIFYFFNFCFEQHSYLFDRQPYTSAQGVLRKSSMISHDFWYKVFEFQNQNMDNLHNKVTITIVLNRIIHSTWYY